MVIQNNICVNMRYLRTFQEVTGRENEMISIPNGFTIKDLLHYLAKKYGYTFDGIELRKKACGAILINGKTAHQNQRENFLQDGDAILVGVLPAGG